MGKSLSIIAITCQVYNINGWSIWPPHLALGDDVELPISMEHLRPYLRKRKGPFIAPPGLRHTQRYYPKLAQSRQLLMDNSKSSLHIDTSSSPMHNDAESAVKPPEITQVETPNTEFSADEPFNSPHSSTTLQTALSLTSNKESVDSMASTTSTQSLIPQSEAEITSSSLSDVSTSSFGTSIQDAPSELSSSKKAEGPNNNAVYVEHEQVLINQVVQRLKEHYKDDNSKLADSFLDEFIALFQQIINSGLGHYDDLSESPNFQALRSMYEHNKFHPFMVSFINLLVTARRNNFGENVHIMPAADLLQRLTSVPKSNENELIRTLESLSQDIIMANTDNLWKYTMWYRMLYPRAVRQGLVPKHIYHDMRDEHTTSRYELNGIIEFTGDNIDYEQTLSRNKSFFDYVDCLKNMIKNEKYPELKKAPVIIDYLQMVFSGLDGDFGDLYSFARQYPIHIEVIRKSFFDVWSLGTYGERKKVKAVKLWLVRHDVGPWLGKHDGLASIFLGRDQDINDFYLFNKDAFDKVSRTRTFESDEDKYYYSLSFVSQELKYNSRGRDIGRSVIIWMYKKLLNEEKAESLIKDDYQQKGRLFRKFGWMYDKHILDVTITFDGFGLSAFNEYMEFVMDIENWRKVGYELQTDCNAPYLNTIKFKAEYLVKVLKDAEDGAYSFKEYKVQNERDARVIKTVQNVLNEWYNEYQRQQSPPETDSDWSLSFIEQLDKTVIEKTFSKDLLEKDYTAHTKSTPYGRLGANIMSKLPRRKGTALTQEALAYFFENEI